MALHRFVPYLQEARNELLHEKKSRIPLGLSNSQINAEGATFKSCDCCGIANFELRNWAFQFHWPMIRACQAIYCFFT
jgi:hypothetical protein